MSLRFRWGSKSSSVSPPRAISPRNEAPRRRAARRCLRFESLETRIPLAADTVAGAAAMPLVRIRLEADDLAGHPITSQMVNQPFLLSAYVMDLRTEPRGVYSAYLDTTFNPTISVDGPISFAQPYSQGTSGSLDTAARRVEEAGGYAGSALPPVGETLLWSIPLKATSAGPASFTVDPADTPGLDVLLVGVNGDIADTDIDYQGATFDIVGSSAQVVGRHVFYNRSKFDGNNAAAGNSDDGAIAPDKIALLPGGTASFANYTSYSRGLNGIMLDVSDLASPVTASDFTFEVGNSNNPSGWTAGPAPSSITARTGAGIGGSTRVTLIWPDGAIAKKWLQVTVKANQHTGLAAPDVFYFGNAVGEVGNSPTNATVSAADEIAARNNPRTVANPASITNPHDFNRDGLVNAQDQIIARNNGTTVQTSLKLIAVPALAAAQPTGALQPVATSEIMGVPILQFLPSRPVATRPATAATVLSVSLKTHTARRHAGEEVHPPLQESAELSAGGS